MVGKCRPVGRGRTSGVRAERRRDADRRLAALLLVARQQDHAVVDAAGLQDGGKVDVDVLFDRVNLLLHAAGVVDHDHDVDRLTLDLGIGALGCARFCASSAGRRGAARTDVDAQAPAAAAGEHGSGASTRAAGVRAAGSLLSAVRATTRVGAGRTAREQRRRGEAERDAPRDSLHDD